MLNYRSLRAQNLSRRGAEPAKTVTTLAGWSRAEEAGLQEKGTLQRLVQRANGVVGILADRNFGAWACRLRVSTGSRALSGIWIRLLKVLKAFGVWGSG